jgi:Rrf2 family protein
MKKSIDFFMYISSMISTTTQYALRALAKLSDLEPETAMLGRELAKEANIPANYLSKILLTLRNAGLLTTARGSGGGYRLAKRPEEIHLIDVVEVFDAPRAKPPCLLGEGECSDDEACSAHHAWKEVRATFVRFLESTTLAEISKSRGAQGVQVSLSSLTKLPGGPRP